MSKAAHGLIKIGFKFKTPKQTKKKGECASDGFQHALVHEWRS